MEWEELETTIKRNRALLLPTTMDAIKIKEEIIMKFFKFFQFLILTFAVLVLSQDFVSAQDYTRNQSKPSRRPSSKVHIRYNVHLQGTGDFGWTSQPATAGTTGENRQLEAFAIQHEGSEDEIAIEYTAYLQDIGWQGWTLMPEWVGTKGEKRRLEAFKIRIVDSPNDYSIYYRAHLAGTGWTDWVKDGQQCGTTQQARAVQAIQVMVVDR